MGLWYRVGSFGSLCFGKLRFKLRPQNRDVLDQFPKLISEERGILFAANHVSFLDPPMIGSLMPRPIYYFARKTLFESKLGGFLLPRLNAIPVNQEKPELSSMKRVIQLLKGKDSVLIFPEGERSEDGIMRKTGEQGVGMIVAKSGATVVPVRIFGAEKAFPRGAKKMKNHPISVVFGEPVRFDELISDREIDAKTRYQAIANQIMGAIAEITLRDSRGE